MSNEFEKEVIDRLARIETKQEAWLDKHKDHEALIKDHERRIRSGESFHYRLMGLASGVSIATSLFWNWIKSHV